MWENLSGSSLISYHWFVCMNPLNFFWHLMCSVLSGWKWCCCGTDIEKRLFLISSFLLFQLSFPWNVSYCTSSMYYNSGFLAQVIWMKSRGTFCCRKTQAIIDIYFLIWVLEDRLPCVYKEILFSVFHLVGYKWLCFVYHVM